MRVIVVRQQESKELVGVFQTPNFYEELIECVDEVTDPSGCEWVEIESVFVAVFLKRDTSYEDEMDEGEEPDYMIDAGSQACVMGEVIQKAQELDDSKWVKLSVASDFSEMADGKDIVSPVEFVGDADVWVDEMWTEPNAKQEAAKLFKQLSRSMDQKYGRHLSALETLFDGDLDSNIPGVPF